MSQPLLQKNNLSGKPRHLRVWLALALVIPAVLAAIALPKIVGGEESLVPAVVPAPVAPAPTPTEGADGEGEEPGDQEPVELPSDPYTVVVSADGDLSVKLLLARRKVQAGEEIRATIRVSNHSMDALHIPAAGEPNSTLAVVVLDAEGNEVRRVVELGTELLPRRTVLIESGKARDLPMTIVAVGEEPLPPGEYSAHVEFDADPNWRRTGLEVWRAPYGPVRSYPETLTVTE